MNARQQKVLARFGQVITFLDANTSVIAPSSIASQRQVLTNAADQITSFAQDQVVKGTESVLAQSLSAARTALRDTFMRQLSTVGLHKLTGKLPTDPNVPNAAQIFAFPATRTNALTLIGAATAMVAAATPYAAIVTANGVNLDQVNAAIQALQSAVNAEGSSKRIAKGATQGIVAQIQAGHGAVRMMDVVIRPLLATNKPLLTQWDSVKRAAGGGSLPVPVPVPVASTTATPAATVQSTSAASPATPATAPAAANVTPAAAPASTPASSSTTPSTAPTTNPQPATGSTAA